MSADDERGCRLVYGADTGNGVGHVSLAEEDVPADVVECRICGAEIERAAGLLDDDFHRRVERRAEAGKLGDGELQIVLIDEVQRYVIGVRSVGAGVLVLKKRLRILLGQRRSACVDIHASADMLLADGIEVTLHVKVTGGHDDGLRDSRSPEGGHVVAVPRSRVHASHIAGLYDFRQVGIGLRVGSEFSGCQVGDAPPGWYVGDSLGDSPPTDVGDGAGRGALCRNSCDLPPVGRGIVE